MAAAQGGVHKDSSGQTRATYGHSIIVDPWGEVVDTLPEDFGSRRVLRATLSRARVARRFGAQIPMAGASAIVARRNRIRTVRPCLLKVNEKTSRGGDFGKN